MKIVIMLIKILTDSQQQFLTPDESTKENFQRFNPTWPLNIQYTDLESQIEELQTQIM
jgi:hypothetical protein